MGFGFGSVIGPYLANYTLDGLDKLVQPNQSDIVQRSYRFSDDFLVISNDIHEVKLAEKRIVK